MTDDLRTRIWRTIEAHGLGWIDNGKPDIARCHCGYRPQRLGESWHYHLADAVIRVLGLRVEYGMGAQHDYSENPEILPVGKGEMEYRTWYGEDFTFRYITDWEADDD